jgi:pSer/pThr/pTyr-binding forkhead associated (FHA) protein
VAKYRVRFLSGSLKDQSFDVDARVVLGRSAEADIQILDKGVSRQHCCILEDDSGDLVIVDLASSNGTWVDGDEILRKPLIPGATVRLGEVECVVDEGDGSHGSEQVKLASGLSEDRTVIDKPLGCGSKLHGQAMGEGWPFCPNCGEKLL